VTITRVGPNKRYSDGWEKAFGGKRGGASASQTKKKPAPSKKAGPKKAKKSKR